MDTKVTTSYAKFETIWSMETDGYQGGVNTGVSNGWKLYAVRTHIERHWFFFRRILIVRVWVRD